MANRMRSLLGGRFDFTASSSPLARRLRQISAMERREEARAFLDQFHQESGASQASRAQRWAEVRRCLSCSGSYDHTPAELAFGARLAWRNHGRCIGRLFWESLEVIDCRHVTQVDAMADRVTQHMTQAFGDGRIKSMITIFAPVRDGVLPAYIESPQISQYAGYVRADGSILGDRKNAEATRIVHSLGWQPPADPSRFDLLPVMIRDTKDRRVLFDLPAAAVTEVPITHPDHPAFDALGLKWYAVPCVSSMILTIGGIDYPCAPFNGFYMGTEIASRNFADRQRFDLLPDIARSLGLDCAPTASPLWRDTALTEANRAVLQSFAAAGVTMVDHHAASDQFMQFHMREQAQGRRVAADWRWIVPPQAGAACPMFHLKMRNFHPVPNFYTARADDGGRLMPFYGDQYQSRRQRFADRLMRRWKLWKRMAW